jgi:filamentous hemagglutinin
MTLRLQNLMPAMLLVLTTLFVGYGTLSQNSMSRGYQLFERAVSGISAHNTLTTLGNFAPPPESASEYANAAERGAVELIDPATLRWTQTSAGGNGRAAIWWDRLNPSSSYNAYPLEPIDVVRTTDGLTTLDHTRAAVALENGITNIPARVHLPTDPLPASMSGRFGSSTTWGEAAAYRAANQRPPLPPTGTTTPPRLSRGN